MTIKVINILGVIGLNLHWDYVDPLFQLITSYLLVLLFLQS